MGLGRLATGLTTAAAVLLAGTVLAACGTSGSPSVSSRSPAPSAVPAALIRERRPIGHGARFHPAATGPVIGPCRSGLGPRRGVHVEIFAANRVVLVAAGIGTRPPLGFSEGRVARARCYGALVTLDPTGVVLIRPGSRLTLAELFRSWGQPLSGRRIASFKGPVTAFVGGRRRRGGPGTVPLAAHTEIVIEVGPHVPPHSAYTFPPGT
jgi:hypothetical protein